MTGEKTSDNPIQAYVAGKRVLIVDSDATTRTSVQRIFNDLSVKPKDLLVAWNYHDALSQIEKLKPEIVISDWHLELHSGLELLNLHKRLLPDRLGTAFVFISIRNSNTIACLAASEEVDAFIIKPFTHAGLQAKLVEVLERKARPTPYLAEVERAKSLIATGNTEDALATLTAARGLDPVPATAFCLEGLIRRGQQRLPEAKALFEAGLRAHPTHYRCLTGLLLTLVDLKRFAEAYTVAHRLMQHYPLEPQLIPILVRLSIRSGNFADLLMYYDVLSGLDEKDQAVASYVSAGLVVCGKHFIEAGKIVEALNALAKAEAVSDGKPQILREILTVLYAAGLEKEADEMFERCPSEVKNSAEVHTARLEKLNSTAPPTRVLQMAKDLLAREIRHPRIYEIALARSIELMQREAFVSELLAQACGAFPGHQDRFKALVARARAEARSGH